MCPAFNVWSGSLSTPSGSFPIFRRHDTAMTKFAVHRSEQDRNTQRLCPWKTSARPNHIVPNPIFFTFIPIDSCGDQGAFERAIESSESFIDTSSAVFHTYWTTGK
jgi:hypothetical protein